jgi:hypothetical protein
MLGGASCSWESRLAYGSPSSVPRSPWISLVGGSMSTTAETSPVSPRSEFGWRPSPMSMPYSPLSNNSVSARSQFASRSPGRLRMPWSRAATTSRLSPNFDGVVSAYAYTTIERLLYTNATPRSPGACREHARPRSWPRQPARRRHRRRVPITRGVRQLTVASSHAARFYERLDYRSTSDS